MKSLLKSLFRKNPESEPAARSRQIRVATCALLLEIAHAEDDLTTEGSIAPMGVCISFLTDRARQPRTTDGVPRTILTFIA